MDWLRAQALMGVPEANDALLLMDFLAAYARVKRELAQVAVAALDDNALEEDDPRAWERMERAVRSLAT